MVRSSRHDFGRRSSRYSPPHISRREGYYQATHRPLNCLLFLLPLIIVYEIGSMMAPASPLEGAGGPDRVIAFYWVLRFLGLFTYVPTGLPGLLVVAILLLWHAATAGRTRVRWQTLAGMAVESFLFCLPILVASRLCQVYLAGEMVPSLRDKLVIDLTAGIYEELIFRLLAIWMLKLVLIELMELPHVASMVVIVIITALMFSGYHYLGAESFQWKSFLFRTTAGLLLGIAYVQRGFGIAVGAHSLYDVIVTLWAG